MHATLPAPASGSVAHALDAARDACAAGAAARCVSMVFDDAAALRVAIDADQLTLVLVNLIDNPVKHGELADVSTWSTRIALHGRSR